MIVWALFIFSTMAAEPIKERDCTVQEGWRVVEYEIECDVARGPICPDRVQLCDTWERGPNGPVYQAETARLSQMYEQDAKGATLLREYMALPEHWREYTSYALCDECKGCVVNILSSLDTGRASAGELRRVEQFAAAIKRAHHQTVGVKLKEEDFVPNLNWKLAN